MEKILYCGMADDILSPIKLVPDFDVLYAIDEFDSAFAKNGTFEGQKEDIKQCLIEGSDENSFHREVYLKYEDDVPIEYIDEQCEILSESDEYRCWRVSFMYKGKRRELVYFHHTNFYEWWDYEIKDIDHLMSMGSVFTDGPFKKVDILFNSISDRCHYDGIYYNNREISEDVDKPDKILKTVRTTHIYANNIKTLVWKLIANKY